MSHPKIAYIVRKRSIEMENESSENVKAEETLSKTQKIGPGNPPGAKSREERERIKKEMQDRIMLGVPPHKIWAELQISRQTYYNYLKQLGDETLKERLRQTNTLLHIYFTRTERLLSKFEEAYSRTQDPLILSRMNNVIQQTFDRLQSAGFIPKTQENIHLTTDKKALTYEDFARAYAEYKKEKNSNNNTSQKEQ